MLIKTSPVGGCGVVLLVLLTGCGGGDPLGRKAVSGNVTLNGSPVEHGNISFSPDGAGATTSSGSVIEGGQFSIERDVGLPVGTYRVRINIPKEGAEEPEDLSAMPGEESPPPMDLAPPEWNINSKQTIEVAAEGPNEFDFDVQGRK